jgi:hypothetical protein
MLQPSQLMLGDCEVEVEILMRIFVLFVIQ